MNDYLKFMQLNNDHIEKLERRKSEILEEKKEARQKFEEAIDGMYKDLLAPLEKEIDEAKRNLSNHILEMESVVKYPAEIIGPILAELVTMFEGEKYLYQETITSKSKWQKTEAKSSEINIIQNIRIIVQENALRPKYDKAFYKAHLLNILKNNEAIILELKEERLAPEIKFKNINPWTGQMKDSINFKNFEYVSRFVDEILAHSIERKALLDEDELSILAQKFYQENEPAVIRKHIMNRELEKEEQQKSHILIYPKRFE